MPKAGFEPAQNLSSDLIELRCAVVITTTPLLELGIIFFPEQLVLEKTGFFLNKIKNPFTKYF